MSGNSTATGLVCGDALRDEGYHLLLEGNLAQMVVADPPYNVPVNCHAVGRGKKRHREFKMASGEMSEMALPRNVHPASRRFQHRRIDPLPLY